MSDRRTERLEQDVMAGNAAELANEYITSMLETRESMAIVEATNWYRTGAEGEHRALCYIATLNEVRAMREEHATRIRRGTEARKLLYGEHATASV